MRMRLIHGLRTLAAAGAVVWGVLAGPLDADAETFEVFYDSFESPDVANRVQTAVPGWKYGRWDGSTQYADRVGLWDEATGTMVTPWGQQAAYTWSERYIQTTNIVETLTAGVTYRLTFNAAAESGLGGIKYKADLLAGTNVLLTVTAATTLSTSNFVARSDTLQFATPLGHFALGQKLGIRLGYISGNYNYVMGFDNVRLVAEETPEWSRTLFYGK